MFSLLGVTWQAMQLHSRLARRLSSRERMMVTWTANAPEVRQCVTAHHWLDALGADPCCEEVPPFMLETGQ
jgi:hypothetical protein